MNMLCRTVLFCRLAGFSLSDFLYTAVDKIPLISTLSCVIASKYWFSITVFVHRHTNKSTDHWMPRSYRSWYTKLIVCNAPDDRKVSRCGGNDDDSNGMLVVVAVGCATCLRIRAMINDGTNCTSVLSSLTAPVSSSWRLYLHDKENHIY